MSYNFDKLIQTLDSYLEIGVPFYDFAVMKDGVQVFRHMNGFIDAEREIRPRGNELYNIYSCSKLITCVAALQLLEKGAFKLDDDLSDYMPEFSDMSVMTEKGIIAANNPIKIWNLFTMTAGFSYDTYSPWLKKCRKDTDGACPTREVMKYLAKEPLWFEPCEHWAYSLCHDVLAALIEVVSEESFGDYVEKHIFDPLGMRHSSFKRDKFDESEIVNQFSYNAEKNIAVITNKNNELQIGYQYESGGAGCISTVDDYIKLEEAIRKGEIILKKETTKLLYTNALNKKQSETLWENNHYGYGLGQRCPKDEQRSDFGWDSMAGSLHSIDIENGISLYFGTHVLRHTPLASRRLELILIAKNILCR